MPSSSASSCCLWSLPSALCFCISFSMWLHIHLFVSLTPLWAPWGLSLCFSSCLLFPGLWEDWCHGLASLTDSTYVPEDSVGGLHAGMNVVRYMTMQQPCPWVISKQLNGLKCPRKEIIHIFSVEIIYLQTSKDMACGFFWFSMVRRKRREEVQ